MSNKLLFTAAVAAGGLLLGAVGSTDLVTPHPTPPPAVRAITPGLTPAAVPSVKPHVVADATQYDSYSHALVDDYSSVAGFLLHADGATTESHEPVTLNPSSTNVVVSSLWVKWKAPASGSVSIANSTLTTVPTVAYAVFTGKTMATAHRVAWVTSEGVAVGGLKLRSLRVVRGVTYHIQVSALGAAGSAAPTGDIDVTLFPKFDPPANDDRANAIGVSGNSWASTAGEYGATLEPAWEPTEREQPSLYARVNSIWWKWTATSDGTLATVMKLDFSPFTESYFAVFEQNDSHELTEVAYGDNRQVQDGTVSFAGLFVRAGWTYYFEAGDVGSADPGPVTVTSRATYTGPLVTSISPARAPKKGGTRVTITGKRLSTSTQVYFGQNPGTNIHVISSTRITVTVPAGTAKGKVPVAVIVSSGQSSATLTGTRYFSYS